MATKPKKPRLKVTNDTIRMRYDVARKDPEFFKKHGRPFGFTDAAKKFGITTQSFWYYHSKNPRYHTLPGRKKCVLCGRSLYDAFSDWINDGSLDHLIPKTKEAENGNESTKS